MTLFNSKLAREVARLTGWKDKIWSRRYQVIVISNEEAAQVARLSMCSRMESRKTCSPQSGDRYARFPIGSFPPHLPFVRAFPAPFLAPG
jgi:hypothetical protein